MNSIEIRKKISKLLKEATSAAKIDHCYLCGKITTNFCNSHLVPAFVLKNIAQDGHVKLFRQLNEDLDDINILDNIKGVGNAGTFRFICHNCDNTYFQDYENETALLGEMTNKILSEIAVKNSLLSLNKRYNEEQLYEILFKQGAIADGIDVVRDTHRLDKRDYSFSLKRSKKIVDNELKSGFCIIFHYVVPYVVPIAIQMQFAMDVNIDGTPLNDVHNYSQDIRMHDIHLVVFPLTSSSLILLFYHKDDRNNIKFERQFNRMPFVEKLEYINYLIFKYTEDYFIAPLKTVLLENEKLSRLAKENYENPNHGYFTMEDLMTEYVAVKPNEIPNFLAEENKLR